MPHRLRYLLPALLLPVLLGGGLTASARANPRNAGNRVTQSIATRIAKVLDRSNVARDKQGVVVLRRGTSPRVIFTRNAATPLRPASAAKVMTAATALDLLGPSYLFRTRFTARGPIRGDTLDGDLVLHGGADPNLSGRFHKSDALYVPRKFATALHRAGIRRVTGALVLDEGVLDDEFVHVDWSEKDKTRWYGAPVGGLSFNDNCIDVELVAPRSGSKANLHLPATAGGWPVRNLVKVRPGKTNGAAGRWIENGGLLQLTGRMKPGGKTSFHVPVQDPARFLGGALLHCLKQKGIRVLGGQRRAKDGNDRMPGRLVAEHVSEMLPTLTVLNERSQNFYASMVFKLAGAAVDGTGSWASGDRAVQAMLDRRHIDDAGGTVMRDGSGLSADNRLSAGVLASVLRSFDEDILRGPLLLESLPTSGETGTLRKRLRERGVKGRVHAKTGTLNEHRTRALAGYVEGKNGHPGYVFAILLNGRGASSAVIDDVVRELTR